MSAASPTNNKRMYNAHHPWLCPVLCFLPILDDIIQVMSVRPISKIELWMAEIVLLIAIGLQIFVNNIDPVLSYGPHSLIIATEIALVVSIAFTSTSKILHTNKLQRIFSFLFLGLITLANFSSFFLVAKALISGDIALQGFGLIVSAIAIFLTNIIVFALWYWEIDSPGLTGHKWSKNDKDFHFIQQELKSDFAGWQPKFLDYLYLSITNAINFSAADGRPLTNQAKALMGTQALISVFTFWLIVARSVSILG